jgi:hypothetical protein
MDGGVSVNIMREFADSVDIPMSSDIGNVISLNDGDIDNFGMDLLANSSYKSAPSQQPRSNSSNSYSIPSGNSGSGGIDIDISPLETIDAISMDLPGTSSDIGITRNGGGQDYGYNGGNNIGQMEFSAQPIQPIVDQEKERQEKADLINKLSRLEAKGFQISKKFTMDNSLDEIKQEFTRLVDARQLETSIKFQRQMMMGLVTGLELMNEKFNPLDWKLGGWSESVHENVEDFDEVFEELYDKYKEKGKMPPEARLLFMLAGSGFMFHMSNSFFRQKAPSMDDILRQNPEMARQFATAAASAAGPGFGNFMGMAMGVPAPGGVQPQQPMGGAPMNAGFMQQQMQQQMPPPMPPRMPQSMATGPVGPLPPAMMPQHMAAAPTPERQTARREMKGPVGVDDILKTFDEVRRAETENVFSPPQNMMQMPSVFNQPAVVAISEMHSVHSDDMASQAESTRTGGTRGGGQRRRRAAPIGNTISLEV